MKQNSGSYKSWQLAITFAEAGEWDTAREMMPSPVKSKLFPWFEKTYTAVAYAEEGMPEEALKIMGEPHDKDMNFLEAVGLGQVKVCYATIPMPI